MNATVPLEDLGTLRTGVLPPKPKQGAAEAAIDMVPLAQIIDGRLSRDGYKRVATTTDWTAGNGHEHQLRTSDVVVSLRMENLAVAIEDEALGERPLFATADAAVFRGRGGRLDPGYLAAWLGQPEVQNVLEQRRRPSGAPRLAIGEIAACAIPLPNMKRQRAIAGLAREVRREQELLRAIQDKRVLLGRAHLRSAFAEGA